MIRQLRASLRDIADDIRARPGRAGLSFLALAIGMTALTVLLAVLGGLQDRARQIVEELGAQVFAIAQAPSDAQTQPSLRLSARHMDLLRAHLPGASISGVQLTERVSAGGDRQVRIVATDEALLDIRPWRIASGRFLDARDLHNRERVAVAEETLAREWNWRVGDVIRLRETPYRLIGLLRIGADALESESTDPALSPGDRALFVPRTLPPYWQFSAPAAEPPLDAIYIRNPRGQSIEQSVALARTLLTQPDQRLERLSFITPEVLLQRLRKLQDTIRFTAGSIAILCLVLGGTTLMSLLVANVRERVTEIGLRRALGATAQDIAGLFVLEAILLTAIAALSGALGTCAVLWMARDRFPIPLRLDLFVLLTPLLVATLLGIAFSFWPARAAARISPAEALRNE
ncbi:MAG: ABC transporter permease [Verrucomicrobia bacterium]|nr:ABC transporter permease [Kiritimatiellia bacterium]MCO6401026.1 ABC transporter permease [Verrucomicrobiota bacterium]